MSFSQYLESKKISFVTASYDHYQESVEREVYDHSLNQSRDFAISYLEEITNLRNNLSNINCPFHNDIALAVATRNPAKIKQIHEQFSLWANKNKVNGSLVEASLLESRSYLYGKTIDFSKENADRIVQYVLSETKNNIEAIVRILEQGIRLVPWNNSTVIVNAIKNKELISNEGMVIVGMPPAITLMCKNENLLEIYDVQDDEGYPESMQQDYATVLRILQGHHGRQFTTQYLIAKPTERPIFENIKKELALGMEKTLPDGFALHEEIPQTDDDIWQIKLKNKVYIEESPIRWLNLVKKAST